MAYDQSDYEREDAEALKRKRAALRNFARDVAEAVQALQLPETYLEAERAVRSVTVADRLIVRVREVTLGDEEDDMPPPAPWATSPAETGEEKEESAPPVGFAATLPVNREGQDEEEYPTVIVQERCDLPMNGAEKEENEEKAPTTIASDGPPPHEWSGIRESEPTSYSPTCGGGGIALGR